MTYEETMDYLKQKIDEGWFYELMGNLRDPITRSLNVMAEDIKKAMATEADVDTEPDNKKFMNSLCNDLLRFVIRCPITKNVKDFIEAYIMVIDNWNSNIAKDGRVKEGLLSVRDFLNYHQSVVRTTETLKSLLQEYARLKSCSLPAYGISAHYLMCLEKSLKEEESK